MAVNQVPMTGSLASIGATALALTGSSSTPVIYGVQIKASPGNTAGHYLYVGLSTVTAGTSVATTDGYPLAPGDSILVPSVFCSGDAKKIFVVSSSTGDSCAFMAY